MPRCTYVLLAGLPGTGKSTLASELAGRLHPSVILNKDEVRAALFPGEAVDYSEAQNDLCMRAMLASAAYLTGMQTPPIYIFFDGRSFSRAAHLDQVISSAGANGADWRLLYLWCEDAVAFRRLSEGSAHHPAKNRDATLYASLKANFEPIQQPHLSLDTGRPLPLSVDECVRYLQSKAA